MGFEVIVNTIVLDDNHQEIIELKKLLDKSDVKMVVDNIIPEGRAVQYFSTDKIRDNASVVAAMMSSKKFEKFSEMYDYSLDNSFKTNDCGIGTTLLFITVNGECALCPSLIEKCPLGNIFDTDFEDIELKKREYNKMLKLLKDCKNVNCEFLESCKGGCRARAFYFNEDVESVDTMSCYRYGRL